jgi:hypothetical protein
MEELVVSKETLVELFASEKLKDTQHGWLYNNIEVEIIALHDVDPKYLQDITNAKFYKIKEKLK